MAVKYFTQAHYWANNQWNYGIEVNSYDGSLWRITNQAWSTNLFTGATFYFKLKAYSSGGTITMSASADANNTTQNSSTHTMPATNAGYYYGVPYTQAQINVLKNGGYLFFRSNFGVYFDGPAGSAVCYSLLDDKLQNAYIRVSGTYRFGNAHVRVGGTWRSGLLTYVRVSGTWRTRGAG